MAIRLMVNSVLAVVLVLVSAGREPFAAEISEEQAIGKKTASEQAITEIEKLGGKVIVDEKSLGKPVMAVDFRGKKVADAGLEHLKSR